MIINLPFDGFYNSLYSDAIDYEEESFIEHITDDYEKGDPDHEAYYPEPLRLNGAELQELLFSASDYSAAYERLAQKYVECFDYVAGEKLGMTRRKRVKWYDWKAGKHVSEWQDVDSLGLRFESMTSPRYYNFETDRIFAHISLATVKKLFALSKAENHATLEKVIKRRFTSCSGFISHYSNRLSDWLEKPLKEWDHNELGTLLIAAIESATDKNIDDTFRHHIFYEMTVDDGTPYEAWKSAVNWQEFDRKRMDARAEKLSMWLEEDREAALAWRYNNVEDFTTVYNASPELFKGFDIEGLPYHCPETPDLFAGKEA